MDDTRAIDGPDLSLERSFGAVAVVAGIDEVGRGAWAGPLTVGAAILDARAYPSGLRDSKRLRPERREALAHELQDRAVTSVADVEPDELDRIGLAAALRVAGQRALDELAVRATAVLIDGPVDLLPGSRLQRRTVVAGDDRSCSIAAASIVAKVHRDGRMVALAARFPAYGFEQHKGYPTPVHREALRRHGPCELHRRSWRPIAALLTEQAELPFTAPAAR